MKVTVGGILDKKGHEVWTVTPRAKVYEALVLMAEKNIGAVLVSENSKIVGILSERDYARMIMLKGKSPENTPVSEIMTASVYCIPPWRTADECMALMTDKRVRHLPVMDGGKLLGVVSIGDVVKTIISEQEFAICELEGFVDEALKQRKEDD